MSLKLVAIGGGENGRQRNNGTSVPYETANIDREIIRLTNKSNPNFLFLGHAQNNAEMEQRYFDTMINIYGNIFGCNCKTIKRDELSNGDPKINELIDWADIIYEGGGDTLGMIELWRESGFDRILKNAWLNGKVICGVSAGANCWFSSCSSDSLKIRHNDPNAPMISVDCLGWFDAFFTPHCNVANENTNRLEHMQESLRNTELIGIGISNCCALEIIDDNYRLVTDDASNYGIDAYGIKSYWKNGKYIVEFLDTSENFKKTDALFSK